MLYTALSSLPYLTNYVSNPFTKVLPVLFCAFSAYHRSEYSRQKIISSKKADSPKEPEDTSFSAMNIFYGLMFSMIGDIALFYDEKEPKVEGEPHVYFMGGIAAFSVAHLLYIRVFYELSKPDAAHNIMLFIPFAVLFCVCT